MASEAASIERSAFAVMRINSRVIRTRRIVGQIAMAIQYTGMAAIIVNVGVLNQLNIIWLKKFIDGALCVRVFDAI